MRGDFSRMTFAQRKHYSSVRKQQGRVDLDADWNEQADITQHRAETQALDTIGRCGAPKYGGGFQIGLQADHRDLTISPGRFYVDGILCELEDAGVTYTTQPDCLMPPCTIGPSEDNRTLALTQGTPYLVYLDVWQCHLTALDDDSIREKALGGPDTASRVKTVWQVLCRPISPQAYDPEAIREAVRKRQALPIPQWAQLTAPSTGEMDARIQPAGGPPPGPCTPEIRAGYSGLENQLYRVEIHKGGPLGTARFKWSRDNGSVAVGIEELGGNKIRLADCGRDEVRGLTTARWAEIVSDRNQFKAGAEGGQLVKILVDPAKREATVEGTLDPVTPDQCRKYHYKLRRWDHAEAASADGLPVTGAWTELENDIEIRFLDGNYQVGDYWLIPARMATGQIEWPPPGTVGTHGSARSPAGIAHHYAPLALITWPKGGQVLVDDLRLVFPPLNDLERCIGACTLLPVPERGWERNLSQIGDGQDALICLKAGTYPLDAPLTLRNKGHIQIRGAGPGTRIVAEKSEVAIEFADCKSVTLRDLSAETGVVGSKGAQEHLGGTLSFCHCPGITIENVRVKSAAGSRRRAACIRVIHACQLDPREQEPTNIEASDVRIRGCDLEVGHMQVGILLINPNRATIEDNRLVAAARPGGLRRLEYLKDPAYRLLARQELIAKATWGAGGERALGGGPASVTVAGHTVSFETSPMVASEWQALVDAHPPEAAVIRSGRDALAYVEKLADAVLLSEGKFGAAPAWREWFRDRFFVLDPDVASAGIVVGGILARDLRILNNNIQNALEGIHIGMSHREATRGAPHLAGRVQIAGNTIRVVLLGVQPRQRRAVFVGNCDHLLVTDNYAEAAYSEPVPTTIDGISIHGYLGRMMIVRENHLVGFTTGVFVNPLNDPTQETYKHQWLVSYNMTPNASLACEVGERAQPGESPEKKAQREALNAKKQGMVKRLENYS